MGEELLQLCIELRLLVVENGLVSIAGYIAG
jgi:hypothetical protein